jgi:hypothetical protein
MPEADLRQGEELNLLPRKEPGIFDRREGLRERDKMVSTLLLWIGPKIAIG